MKRKALLRVLSLTLSAAMLLGLAGCGNAEPADAPKAETPVESVVEEVVEEEAVEEVAEAETDSGIVIPEFEERVELDVVAFVEANELDGRRSDPVSKWIEDTLNVDLYLTHITEADWPTQLSTMLADNDLPDIFMLSDPGKQFPMLYDAGSVLDYSPYLEEYAPNTMADPGGLLMLEANSGKAWSPDGGKYLWGMVKGMFDDGTAPSSGHYIRWDLYAEAGYPKLESYDEDLLDVMEAMVALEPETDDGRKTYGTGAWFGNGQGWGEWVFTYGLGPQTGVSLREETGDIFAVNTIDSTPINVNQLTDPEGIYWRAVRFYNKAYQRGLLDPDSFTMQSDVYEENLKAGMYMFNCPGWMAGRANTEFNKTEGNTKMFISIPATGSDAENRYTMYYRGERQYVINAGTENPERCVALLDLVSTHEFSRMSYCGLEGDLWEMIDGVATPKAEFVDAETNDALRTEKGVQIYHHFLGYGNGTLDPVDGGVMDLKNYSPEATAKKMNSTLEDFIKYYGQDSWTAVYDSQTTHTVPLQFISLNAEGDMASYLNELSAYRGKEVFKCVAAKTDAEFEQMRDEMINELKNNYHAEELFEYFYNQASTQTESVAKLVELSNNVR